MNKSQTCKRIERSVPGLHDSLIERLPPHIPKGAPVLDLGCGTGAWLERMSNTGFTNLHGVDASAGDSTGVAANIYQANLDDPHWATGMGTFAFITIIEVLEHLENPGLFIGQLSGLLQNTGRILITTPNVHSLVCRLRYFLLGKLKQFDDKGDPTHIYPVFIENLVKILDRHGLQIEAYWGYPESGKSITSRPALSMIGGTLRHVLPEKVGGDVLCMLIKKKQTLAISVST